MQVAAAALVAATMMVGAAQAAPTLEDYGRLPNVSSVEVSPDGSKLAMLVGDAEHRQLQVRQTGDHKPVFVGSLGSAKVRWVQWAGPQHVLVIGSVTAPIKFGFNKAEWFEAADLDLATGRLRKLMAGVHDGIAVIQGRPQYFEIDGKPTLVVESLLARDGGASTAMYRVDLENGHAVPISIGEWETMQFQVGPDGQALARADYDTEAGRWTLNVMTAHGWKEAHVEIDKIDTPSILGLGRDGRSLLVATKGEQGEEVHEVGLSDLSWSPPIAELEDRAILRDPRTHFLIGSVGQGMSRTEYAFFDPHDQAAWEAATKPFHDEEVELESWSADRHVLVLKVEGPRDGVGYFVVDTSKGSAAWLADEYAAIGPDAVSEKRVLTYKAADGMEIPAYLTVPRNRPAKGLPLIVLVHGGPAARDEPGFDWWSQALASQGYAVLQPQYRGSAGFGQKHLEAGYGQWGRKMQTDVSDGVRYLAASGEIDPKRVCIVGASYGGYAALAGAVFDPSAYRCAVSLAGPSDLGRMLGGVGDLSVRYWDRFMGSTSSQDRALDAISPALHADKAAMPILLIHGQDDTVVRYEQSREMEAALKRAGKPVEFVTLKGEDHWLSRSDTRLQMLEATVDFLKAHNPPDPPTPAAAAAPSGTASAAAKR
jgi:dipeptidyl aminopeptidase/acylaminoacyl peptidase